MELSTALLYYNGLLMCFPCLLLMADLGCQFDTPGKGELHLKNYLHQTELWASLGDKFLIDNRCEEVQPRMGSTIPGQEGLSYKKDSWANQCSVPVAKFLCALCLSSLLQAPAWHPASRSLSDGLYHLKQINPPHPQILFGKRFITATKKLKRAPLFFPSSLLSHSSLGEPLKIRKPACRCPQF